jgi:hypothetical protein
MLMGYTVVWVPLSAIPPFGEEMPECGSVSMPHCVNESEVDTAGGGINAALDPKTLGRGILIASGDPSPFVSRSASDRELVDVLRILQRGYRAESVDGVCSNFAAQLRAQYGMEAGVHALRRAVQLVPGSVLCRGDLIVTLQTLAGQLRDKAPALFAEAAAEFEKWLEHDTTRCRNEAVVFGMGLVALSYVGQTVRRNALYDDRPRQMAINEWIERYGERVLAMRAGEIEDYQFLFDLLEEAARHQTETEMRGAPQTR